MVLSPDDKLKPCALLLAGCPLPFPFTALPTQSQGNLVSLAKTQHFILFGFKDQSVICKTKKKKSSSQGKDLASWTRPSS